MEKKLANQKASAIFLTEAFYKRNINIDIGNNVDRCHNCQCHTLMEFIRKKYVRRNHTAQSFSSLLEEVTKTKPANAATAMLHDDRRWI